MTREEAIKVLENPDVSIGVATRIGQDPEYWRKLKPALDMAISALRQQERFGETNKSLTLDELSERNAPVFLPIKDFPNGGYWCLCENGYIIPPSGHGFMAKERPNWVFYSRKPEEDDHDERKENENA